MKEIEAIKTLVDKELVTKEEGYNLIIKLFDLPSADEIETDESRGIVGSKPAKKPKKSKTKIGRKSMWTKEIDRQIKKLYPKGETDEVAKEIGINRKQLMQRAWQLGVEKKNKKKRGGWPPKQGIKTPLKRGPIPKGVKCSNCNSTETISAGSRGDAKRYYCKNCEKKFTIHPKEKPIKQETEAKELTEKLQKPKAKSTEEVDDFIIKNFDKISKREIAEKLGIDQNTVSTRIRDFKTRGVIKEIETCRYCGKELSPGEVSYCKKCEGK